MHEALEPREAAVRDESGAGGAKGVRVRPTEARIDLGALAHNLREARRCACRARVLAVV